MRVVLAVTVLIACGFAAWAGEPAAPGVPAEARIADGTRDFERNVALGAILQIRPGTPTEMDELRLLADRGLKAAQALAVEAPDSAEAQYLLGSWLLYGYRAVKVEQIAFDAATGARTETVTRVIQGMSDDPGVGLDALRKSTVLAPDNGDFLLDYGAALLDWDRMFDATGILKGIWAGEPPLSQAQKMRAGVLLGSISEAQGDLAAAREWIYSALSLDAASAQAVEHLRRLDAAQVAAAWDEFYRSQIQEIYDEEYSEEDEEGVSDIEPLNEAADDELSEYETEGGAWAEEETYSE